LHCFADAFECVFRNFLKNSTQVRFMHRRKEGRMKEEEEGLFAMVTDS
jgi:hypothetical protein